MARKLSQSDPALSIDFWNSGFYTYRSQLFAPLRPIGVNVVSLHDSVIDGMNMEDTDLLEWSRRPGFSIFCPVPLNPLEVVDEFYSFRNLNGEVVALFDSNQRIAQFTDSDIDTIITKTITTQGYEQNIQSMMYFSDGAGADMQKWLSTAAFSNINPSTWGIPAPTTTPSIFNRGCWLPKTNYQIGNAILDPNGNVEVVVATFGAGISGNNEPLWPTTAASTINDASVQWENAGPLEVWLPNQSYPVPVVVLDTNGNLQLATAANNNVSDWNDSTTYQVGDFVFFGGNYWTAVASNTDMAPSEQYAAPTWVLSQQNPITTGPTAPAWNTTVGGSTTDGQYTWKNIGPGQLTESFGTSYVYCYRTIYGHLSTASPISINTGAIFGPVAAAITAFQITGNVITGNVITFFGTNNFVPGNVFTPQGLSTSTGELLNGQAFSIIAAGTSPTQFSAVFMFPNTPLTQDSGSTLNLIASVTGIGTTSPLCNATASITASSASANIVTIYANNGGTPLSFVPGLFVTITGMTSSIALYINNQQFQIINVDPNGTWFQILVEPFGGLPNQTLTGDSGTATFNAIEIYRTSDGGGIYLFAGAVTNPSGSIIVTPYDSGVITAGAGSDNGVPGFDAWTSPNNVTSDVSYATVHLVAPSSGPTNFVIVQQCSNITQQSGTGILTASFTQPVTPGNSIIVVSTAYHVNSIGFTDNNGNSYTPIAEESTANINGVTSNLMLLATDVAGGSTNVQMNAPPVNSNNFLGFGAFEVSGLVGTYQVNGSFPNNGTYQTTGTTLNTGTMMTANPNMVVFSFIWEDLNTNSGNTVTPPAGYNTIPPSGFNLVIQTPASGERFQQMSAVYQVEPTSTTVSPTWGTPSNNTGLGLTVAFDLQTYSPSNGLIANDYALSVPPNIAIGGIQVTLNSEFTGTGGQISVQLLKNGAPVGSPKFITPTGSVNEFTLGSSTDLWGTTWQFSDFNSAFGVVMQATIANGGSAGTFSINDVTAEVFGATSTTGWVYNDFTPDADLNVLLIAPQNHLNDPPPGAPGSSISNVGTLTTYWNGRIWMVVGNYIYFDAGPDCTNGVPEEAWPPANRFQFSGPVLNIVPTADGVGLLVFLADRVNAILGGPETISFYPTDALSNFGISSPNSIFRDGSTIGLFTTQKQYFEIIGNNKEELGEHIADYLTENFNPTTTYVTMHRNGLDVGMFISNGTDRIIRYGSNIGAWSCPAFPIGGAGALRSIETTVGVTTLMLASPVPATSAQTPLLNPTIGASLAGSGVVWTDPENITVGSPTSYASVTLTAESSQVLQATKYPFNIPNDAIVLGVEVQVTGKSTQAASGIGAFDKGANLVNTSAENTFNIQLTPAQPNELVVVAGFMDQNNTASSYYPTGGGGAIDSYSISAGVITVTGENNLTPGQIVTVSSTGGSADKELGGPPFTVLTASGSGWTADTSLPDGSVGGASGFCSVLGWFSLTYTNSETHYTHQTTVLDCALIGSSTGIFPSSLPLLKFEGSNTTQMAGSMLLFTTDGGTVTVANALANNNSNPTQTVSMTAGNTILVWGVGTGNGSDPGVPTVSDTQSNPYTVLESVYAPAFPSMSPTRSFVAIAEASATGSNAVTVSWPGAGFGFRGIVNELTHIVGIPLVITPANAVAGAESDSFSLGLTNTTVTFGSSTDLWGMPNWTLPPVVNGSTFGFDISASVSNTATFDISEVQVSVFYQAPANFLRARDVNNWADNATFGVTGGGVPYDNCYVTVGSITLTQPGAELFPLQHVVGYFDAVGNLGFEGNGGPSYPNLWIMPNEVSANAGVGFIQIPSDAVIQEPPIGQTNQSASLLQLRFPINMFNSGLASQYMHHLQVKVEFEPENAPNTLKAMSFKEDQS